MKNNFFMCSLMAFCLFSLQTINTSENTSESKDVEEQKKQQRRKLIVAVRSEEATRPLIEGLQEKERNSIQETQKDKMNEIVEKQRKIEERKTKIEQNRLFNAITTNDVSAIKDIVTKNPLIVAEPVPALNEFITFRDLAIVYDNVTLIKEINDILASKPSVQEDLMGKFPVDFKNNLDLEAIPLNAAVLLNSSPDMIKQITRWNSFSSASFDSDTKRRRPEYFNINIPALQKIDSQGNLLENLPQELKKAGAYTRRIMKACSKLIDQSALVFDSKNFPWNKREVPIFASNKNEDFKLVTRQYKTKNEEELPPRLVLRPVIDFEKFGNLKKILDLEEEQRIDKEGREIIEAEIKARDEIAKALRIDKEARRLQEAQRIEAQRIEAEAWSRFKPLPLVGKGRYSF